MASIEKRLDKVETELDRQTGGGVLFLLQDEDNPGIYHLEDCERVTAADLDELRGVGLVLFEYTDGAND